MANLKFKIVTPERVVLDEEVSSLTCPTTTGQITVLPNHIPLVSTLVPGELVAHVNGDTRYYAVSGGFVEVRPGNEVVVLADSAEHSSEIDLEAAEQAKQKAQEDMENARARLATEEEFADLSAQFQRNLVRIKVAKRNLHRGRHGVGSEGVMKE